MKPGANNDFLEITTAKSMFSFKIDSNCQILDEWDNADNSAVVPQGDDASGASKMQIGFMKIALVYIISIVFGY